MLILCTVVYAFFILIDAIPLVKKKLWMVLAIYSILITTAYVFTVLTELGVKIPSPADPIKQLVISIVGK